MISNETLERWGLKERIGRTWFLTNIGVALSIVAVFVACTLGSVAFTVPLFYQECQNTAEIAGVEYEWDFFAGCFYEYEGHMVPDSVWHNNQSDTTIQLD